MKKIFLIMVLTAMIFIYHCNKSNPGPDLTELQKRAQWLAGTWANPTNIQVPPGVGLDIIDKLSMTFSVDGNFSPAGFNSLGSPLIFEAESNSSWAFNNGNVNNILLSQVSPVNSFTIAQFNTENKTMTINFYHPGLMNFANKDGDYVVDLTKQ